MQKITITPEIGAIRSGVTLLYGSRQTNNNIFGADWNSNAYFFKHLMF